MMDNWSIQGARIAPTHPFIPFQSKEINQSIVTRFEQQASLHHNKKAIHTTSTEWTYLQLNQTANQISNVLLQALRPDQKTVGILMRPGAMMIAGILGILKSGRSYLPLDISFSQNRMTYMLNDSKVTLLITDDLDTAYPLKRQLFHLTERAIKWGYQNPNVTIHPDMPACSLYTSGTTGDPKRFTHSHQHLLRNIMNYTNGLHISANDRLSQLSSCSFAASISDLFGALLNGACLYPFDLKTKGLTELLQTLENERLTIYHSVPGLYRRLLTTLTKENQLPHLRLIKLGGDVVLKSDFELYKRHFDPKCLFHVGYGSTEMNIIRQFFCNHHFTINAPILPVGYPVDSIDVAVSKETQEITIHRSEFPQTPIHTGDLGKLLEDGCLFVLGRKDFQVKIRGYRVNITEIELAILKAPHVKEAIISVKEKQDEKYLMAWIVATEGKVVEIQNLKKFLKTTLADYLVPSEYSILESLPTTPNGKIDRQALSTMEPVNSCEEVSFSEKTPSCNPVEEKLIEMWKEILNLSTVDCDADFFEVGGHSLAALSLFGKIATEYGTIYPPSILYQTPTIRQLSKHIQRTQIQEAPLEKSYIIPMKTTGSRPPLFFIPMPNIGALRYRKLINYLDKEQPAYTLEQPALDIYDMTPDDVALFYLEKIKQFLPNGPFLLIGYSSAGILALAMARQLIKRQLEPAFFAMLDTTCPNISHQKQATLDSLFKDFTRYPGKMILYSSKQQIKKPKFSVDRGWKPFISDLSIYKVPGNHQTMMNEPSVQTLAKKLNKHLESLKFS